MADVTFVVHKEWLDNIQGLPVETQDKVIAEFVRYGCGEPLKHSDDPGVMSLVNMLKSRIDYSKDKYNQKIEAGKGPRRKKKVDDTEIYLLAQEGKTSAEIAEILGCSKSSIDHSDGWRRRKENSIEKVEKFEF